MKSFSAKKIVVLCISILGSIVLVLSLFSKILTYNFLSGISSVEFVNFTYENGFSLLDFQSSVLNNYLFDTVNIKYFDVTLVTILIILVLAIGVLGFILNTLALFFFSNKSAYKCAKTFNILGLVFTFVFGLISIIMVRNINFTIQRDLTSVGSIQDFTMYQFKTFAYLPFIFQAIVLIASLICEGLVTENSNTKIKEKNTKNKVVNTSIVSNIEKQNKLGIKAIDVLKRYNELRSQDIINEKEFEIKKQRIIFDESNIDLYEETIILDEIVKYYDVYKDGVISIDDFDKKKKDILKI